MHIGGARVGLTSIVVFPMLKPVAQTEVELASELAVEVKAGEASEVVELDQTDASWRRMCLFPTVIVASVVRGKLRV